MSDTPITITICQHSVDRRFTRCLLCEPEEWEKDYWAGHRQGQSDVRAEIRAAVEALDLLHAEAFAGSPWVSRAAVLRAIEGER